MRFRAEGWWLVALCASAIAVLSAAPAEAQNRSRLPCDIYQDPRYGACMFAYAGSHAAEWHRDRGDEIARVFLASGNRIVPPIVIVEIVHARNGTDRAILRDPLDRRLQRSYPFDRNRFAQLRAQLVANDRQGTLTQSGYVKVSDKMESVCLDPATGWMETVLDGHVKRFSADYCESGAQAFEIVLNFAVPLAPECAPLIAFEGWSAQGFRDCLHLGGNLAVAAQGYVASEQFAELPSRSDWAPNGKDADMIAADAVLDIAGKPRVAGRDGVRDLLASWEKEKNTSNWYSPSYAFATAAKVFIRGTFTRHVDLADQSTASYETDFSQIWRRESDGKFRLTEWHIGPLKEAAGRQRTL